MYSRAHNLTKQNVLRSGSVTSQLLIGRPVRVTSLLTAVMAGCDVTLKADNGSLYSPAYSVADYPTNLQCDYLIQRPGGGPLSLRFTHLTLDETDGVQVSQGHGGQLGSPAVHRGCWRSAGAGSCRQRASKAYRRSGRY